MNWKEVTLGNFIKTKRIDIQTGPFGTQLRASDYTNSGTPVINVRNIGYGELKNEKMEYIPENVLIRLQKHTLIPGDIVFGRKGAVDRHLLVKEWQKGWVQGSDCIRLRLLSNDILPSFLSYVLKNQHYKKWILAQCSNKATMASLNQDVIFRITLKLPDIHTQYAIVNILSAYDDLIENNRRRIQLLEKTARTLYKEWFVRLRFPGHEHVKVVDGVPEGWEKKRLGEVAILNYGKSLKVENRIDGNIPVYASSGIVGMHNKPLVRGHGIIVGRKGNVGSIYWVEKEYFPIDTVYYIKPEQANLYLYYALKNISFISTDVAVPGLKRDYAHRKTLLIPDKKIYIQFIETVGVLHNQIEKLYTCNKKLAQARDLLLPKLMSGEVTV